MKILPHFFIFIFFALAGQCADLTPSKFLFVINGMSNFGKSTTADTLRDKLPPGKVARCSIDYFYTSGVWRNLFLKAEKYLHDDPTWEDFENTLKVADDKHIAFLINNYKYAVDFFTNIRVMGKPSEVLKLKGKDVIENFFETVEDLWKENDIVIVDQSLALCESNNNLAKWNEMIARMKDTQIIFIHLVSDMASYNARLEKRNSSDVLYNHRAGKGYNNEVVFKKYKESHKKVTGKVTFNLFKEIDISNKNPDAVAEEILRLTNLSQTI